MSESTRALVYTAPQQCDLREVPLARMQDGMVEVRTLYSAISRGTERLVFNGLVPASEYSRMRAPFQSGDFPFPVAYGYAAVGLVEDGPADLIGKHVFSLSPHQEVIRLPAPAVVPLPDGVPPARAVLAANTETALNAIWDSEIAPGTSVLVVGAGLLGCLIAALLSVRTDLTVFIIDVLPERGAILTDFPVRFITTTEKLNPVATVFHTSATGAGLQAGLEALAFEGQVIELSWYGDTPVTLDLGGAFHANRLTIKSSQVGHVATSRRASTTYRDRLLAALGHLRDPGLDALVTEELAFDALADNLPRLLGPAATGIASRIRY
ncbi:MAG: zinc-binding alcohol dehydrogenase [Pseudomonadota bacterium]